jgi:hypothetical protein
MKSFVFASCISSLLLLATAPAGAAAPLSLRCTLDAGHEDWGERHEYNFDELGFRFDTVEVTGGELTFSLAGAVVYGFDASDDFSASRDAERLVLEWDVDTVLRLERQGEVFRGELVVEEDFPFGVLCSAR